MKCLVVYFLILIIIVSASPSNLTEKYKSETCWQDSNYLGLELLSKSTINPCNDFPAFVRDGWQQSHPKPVLANVVRTIYERITKLLTHESVDDAKLVKVAKKFYKKCRTSKNKHVETWNEITEYLISLGSCPFIEATTWSSSNFSLENLFKHEPKVALKVFLNRKVVQCNNEPGLCLKDYGYDLLGMNSYERFLNELFELEELANIEIRSKINGTAAALEAFDYERNEFITLFEKPSTKIPIRDLQSLLPRVNWVEVINSLSTAKSQLIDDDYIYVENYEGAQKLAKFTREADEKILADRFAVHFIYEQRAMFGLDFLGQLISQLTPDLEKACAIEATRIFLPVLNHMNNKLHLKSEVKSEAEKLAREAAHELSKALQSSSIARAVKEQIVSKLESLMIHDGYMEYEWDDMKKLDEIYKNANLNGDEGEFRRTQKLDGIERSFDLFKVTKLYDADANILTIPSLLLTAQCFFDINRSRLMNAAIFQSSIVGHLIEGLQRYFNSQSIDLQLKFHPQEISYESYKAWLDLGNRDMNLMSSNLTPNQVFWVAAAMNFIAKEERSMPSKLIEQRDEFLHPKIKQLSGFKEAFNCTMSDDEKNWLENCRDACKLDQDEIVDEIMIFILEDAIARHQEQKVE